MNIQKESFAIKSLLSGEQELKTNTVHGQTFTVKVLEMLIRSIG